MEALRDTRDFQPNKAARDRKGFSFDTHLQHQWFSTAKDVDSGSKTVKHSPLLRRHFG